MSARSMIFAMSFALFVMGCEQYAGKTTTEVNGRVVDTTGQGVGGASVRCYFDADEDTDPEQTRPDDEVTTVTTEEAANANEVGNFYCRQESIQAEARFTTGKEPINRQTLLIRVKLADGTLQVVEREYTLGDAIDLTITM